MPVAVHTRQTSHIGTTGTVESAYLYPTNFEEEWGTYQEAYCLNNNVWFQRSDFAKPPMAILTQVTDSGQDASPRLTIDPWRRRWIVFHRGLSGSSDVLRTYSDDDGATWGTPVVILSGGRHPNHWTGHDGTYVVVAYVGGVLVGMRQAAGETALSSPFTLQVWNGSALVNLAVEDDSFGLSHGFAPDAPWLLVARKLGSGGVNRFVSFDEALTFSEVV